MLSKKQHYYYDQAPMRTKTGANIQSVWQVTGTPFTGAHCATFPPELIEPIVLASCPEGGVIFDPFGGSGTVALVAKQHKRHFVLSEISPDIAALAQKRSSEGITNNDKKRLEKKLSETLALKQDPLPLSDMLPESKTPLPLVAAGC